jgi:hypothetical protein
VLVRRVKQGQSWHQATDNLAGTQAYGTYGTPTSDSSFSLAWNSFVTASGWIRGEEKISSYWQTTTGGLTRLRHYHPDLCKVEMAFLQVMKTKAKCDIQNNYWLSIMVPRPARSIWGVEAASVTSLEYYLNFAFIQGDELKLDARTYRMAATYLFPPFRIES